MQPYTADFAKNQLTAQKGSIAIGKYRYRADIGPGAGNVLYSLSSRNLHSP
jgi:hypothetical protein